MSGPIICPGCDREIPVDGKIRAAEVSAAFAELGLGGHMWSNLNNRQLTIRDRSYTVHLIHTDNEWMPQDEYDRQGQTYSVARIYEIGGELFRVSAVADSYGEEHWDGATVKAVKRVTKTVEIYE